MNYVSALHSSKDGMRALDLSYQNFRQLRCVDRRLEHGIPATMPRSELRSTPANEDRTDKFSAIDLARYAIMLALVRLGSSQKIAPPQVRRFLFESITQDLAIRMLRGEPLFAVLVPPEPGIFCVKSLAEVDQRVCERAYIVNATKAVQRMKQRLMPVEDAA